MRRLAPGEVLARVPRYVGARYAGAANTFTIAGVAVMVLTTVSLLVGRGPHQHRVAAVTS